MTMWKPITLFDNICAGLNRSVNDWREMNEGLILNLGSGKKHIVGAVSLDARDGWFAPELPYLDNSVNGIYAYHFLEHLDKNTVLKMLQECQRVLVVGGLINIAVPWSGSQIAFQDLDHKSFWTPDTFRVLFQNEYYQGATNYEEMKIETWRLKPRSVMLAGLEARSIMVFAQLEKGSW